jgi:hypothetical protein
MCTTTPAETLQIAPESLEVANAYLQTPDIKKVANQLGIPPEIVSDILERKEVRNYVNSIFFSCGFSNKFQVRDLIDTIIKKKLQELDESDTGSTKDIIEILALSHKINIEMIQAEMKLEEMRTKNSIKKQVNVQINEAMGGTSKYSSLIERLIGGSKTDDVVDV